MSENGMAEQMPNKTIRKNARQDVRVDARQNASKECQNRLPKCQIECQTGMLGKSLSYTLPDDMSETMTKIDKPTSSVQHQKRIEDINMFQMD